MTGRFVRGRAPTVIALAMLALSACGRFARHGTTPSSAPPVNYGNKTALPSHLAPGSNAAAKKTGTIQVTVLDDRGRRLPGAIVRLKGTRKASRATDARGRATFTVPPGDYVAEVAPCGTTVITDTYGASTIKVAAGQTVSGPIDGITWHLRFRPEGSVTTSRKPPWPAGADVTLGVRISDGCDISKIASGVSLASYQWTASDNFRIVRAATRANADGFAPITVRCTAPGDGSIAIRHRSDAKDYVDLLLAGAQPPSGAHWCA